MEYRRPHIKFDLVQRRKLQSAVKVAAYGACARVTDRDGKVYDFRRKKKELRGHEILVPNGAPAWASTADVWRRCEAAEKRSDAQTARLSEIEISRAVPESQWMNLARHIAQPWVDEGMAVQVNVHCVTGSDGKIQPHIHYEMTMRRFDGDGFANRKELAWNDAFTAKEEPSGKRGSMMRGQMCARANEWLEAHNIDVRLDHRARPPEAIEEIGPPEQDVPKKSWKAWQHDPNSAAARPVREVLESREIRHQLKAANAARKAAEIEVENASREWQRHQPGVFGPSRQRRQGEKLTWNPAWSPKIGGAVTAFEIKDSFAVLHLKDGSQVIDSGTRLAIKGKVTDQAIAVMLEQAKRHGWGKVLVTGNAEDKAKIAAALEKHGIEIANPPKLEPAPQPHPQYRPSWADGPKREEIRKSSS